VCDDVSTDDDNKIKPRNLTISVDRQDWAADYILFKAYYVYTINAQGITKTK